MSSIWALPRKLRGNYYRLRRLLNETIFVSIPRYKNTQVKERQVFYKDEIERIIGEAKKYASPFPVPSERFEDFEYGLSVTDVSSDILKRTDECGVKYYRGILPGYAPYFKELYATGVLQSLVAAGRIAKITPTNYYTNDYPMIIEVETLHVVNPAFWSFSMIRECVINLLLIDKVLEAFGYGVIDGHPFNTAFKGGRPVMFDIGSFVKRQACQFAGELLHYQLNTLMMLSMNRSHFARHNIYAMNMPARTSTGHGISIEKQALYNLFYRYHTKHSSRGYVAILSEVFKEKIIKPEYVDVLFSQRLEVGGSTNPFKADEKSMASTFEERIIDLVQRFSPNAKSVLDIAGGHGHLGHRLAETGKFESIISLDPDEDAVEEAIAKHKGENVTFYHVNPFFPFGEREPFAASVRSDAVLAISITRRLILEQGYKLHAILSIISMYTRRHAYVEFAPLGDGSTSVPAWHNEKWFEEKFNMFFTTLHKEVLETINVGGVEKPFRIIYVGEKVK